VVERHQLSGDIMKTYRSTGGLDSECLQGKWREGTQRNLVVAALRSRTTWTVDSLVKELDGPAYWDTVRHKNKNGEPSGDSWLIQKAGGIRGSVMYHLNRLSNDGLIKVVHE
jgi:hypothetical protein